MRIGQTPETAGLRGRLDFSVAQCVGCFRAFWRLSVSALVLSVVGFALSLLRHAEMLFGDVDATVASLLISFAAFNMVLLSGISWLRWRRHCREIVELYSSARNYKVQYWAPLPPEMVSLQGYSGVAFNALTLMLLMLFFRRVF